MPVTPVPGPERPRRGGVRAAELVASLSLATDLGMRLPVEHGLRSTLVATRLGERLRIGHETAVQVYYGCLLFYIGCTVDSQTNAELFEDGALVEHFTPVMFASPPRTVAGLAGALAGTSGPPPARAYRVAVNLPRAVAGHRRHLAAMCEVARMIVERVGLPGCVRELFGDLTERWDGRGDPGRLRGDRVPLAVRIVHVARDAAFQCLLGGAEHAARTARGRGGHAFDPEIAALLADRAEELLAPDTTESAWHEVLAREPAPELVLRGTEIDRALAAAGDFADLLSPYLTGHSSGTARLAEAAARRLGLAEEDVSTVRRAGFVHDLGRVAVPPRIWGKSGPLTPDEWEQVRLHTYHGERVLCRSPFLAALVPAAVSHHERLDGTGYHRGLPAPALGPAARLLAAADAYHAMTEPRPHREALSPARAADGLVRQARDRRLDPGSVTAVLEAAGQRAPGLPRPAGLTGREAEVVALLARGLPTKRIGRVLGISAKTADHHVQNAYAKIGVSTRAAAALFAMEHGLVAWGELPMPRERGPS
ncbi:HD domain-containing phosphohydrolase [Nocardiopsis sp. FR26]|uniref:HD domain-containing phosphohydrolase n=1 Tax=Nocardiopsis sp. FR26 TaxID=2605987 RepID=UPI0013573436|nr:HD domain-containing phosphohydrolase [Nocardiopsis sp. FR26]